MRVLNSEEAQEVEQQALARPGMSALVLLQRAGHAVTQFCVAHFKFRTVCVVCGAAKNGARGLAAAESLRQVAESVSVILLASSADALEPDTAAFCSQLNQEPIWILGEDDFQSPPVQEALQADLIIDAIADSRPPLSPLQHKAVESINEAFGTIVSVDVPSGVDADSPPRFTRRSTTPSSPMGSSHSWHPGWRIFSESLLPGRSQLAKSAWHPHLSPTRRNCR
jgi:hydroxyethylthiazole kinase-like uncharacterized protein yjeF